jgi:hypothetical protein
MTNDLDEPGAGAESKGSQIPQQEEIPEATDFWIFGYGSLIWKPPPHYDERVPGWVEGYVRRFWQVRAPAKNGTSANSLGSQT